MRSRRSHLFWLTPLAALAAGCVMPDQLNQIQKDLADVRQELRDLRFDQQETVRKVEAVEQSVTTQDRGPDRGEIADLRAEMDRVARQTAQSEQRVAELAERMDRLSHSGGDRPARPAYPGPSAAVPPAGGDDPVTEDLPIPGAVGTAPGAPPEEALPDAKPLYDMAYGDFSKGNFALAISGFQEFVETFPEHVLADNALYYIGECHFSQGNFPDAIAAFDQLLESYPDSDRAAAGNLKKALAYLEQNQIGQAIVQLRYVETSFPGSDEAKIARDKLTSLGA